MTLEDRGLPPEPWLTVEDDPLTGLRNMLSLIIDLSADTPGLGVAVGFDICGLRQINDTRGTEEGNRLLAAFAQGMKRAASMLEPNKVALYRIGGDEFVGLIAGSPELGKRFLSLMQNDDDVPVCRSALVELSPQAGKPGERFFEIWAALEETLQRQRDPLSDPMKTLASRLVEQVKETVEHLKASRRMAYTDDISGLPNQRAAMYLISRHLTCGKSEIRPNQRYNETARGEPSRAALGHPVQDMLVRDTSRDDKPDGYASSANAQGRNAPGGNTLLRDCDDEDRTTGKISLLFIDGDNLRQYNDTLGYEAGNEMIRKLGAILSGSTSPGELVARWLSGDEFMIVLPGYGKEQAMEKARDICDSVRKKSADWVYPVTISIGVGTLPDDGTDLSKVIAKVEDANARAKNAGKNQVCAAR